MTSTDTPGPSGRVAALAALARVTVTPERAASLEQEFSAILSYIDQLHALAPSATDQPSAPTLINQLRDDTDPTPPGTWTGRITRAFPRRSGDALAVKAIITHD